MLALLFMRSLRYAVVSTVPILLVVAWLYAFMYLAGFGINVVTAIVPSILIAVGFFRELIGAGEALRSSSYNANNDEPRTSTSNACERFTW